MKNVNSYKSIGFDLTNDTYCQVYRGTLSAGKNTDAAVEATSGEYAVFITAPSAHTLLSLSSGGSTEDNVNVYGNSFDYLKASWIPLKRSSPVCIPNYKCT
jgi:stage II sporulation protein D